MSESILTGAALTVAILLVHGPGCGSRDVEVAPIRGYCHIEGSGLDTNPDDDAGREVDLRSKFVWLRDRGMSLLTQLETRWTWMAEPCVDCPVESTAEYWELRWEQHGDVVEMETPAPDPRTWTCLEEPTGLACDVTHDDGRVQAVRLSSQATPDTDEPTPCFEPFMEIVKLPPE